MENSNGAINTLKTTAFWIGVLLVAIGAGTLLYLGGSIFELFTDPANNALLQWVTARANEGELFLGGHLDQSQFAIKASPALQYLFFGVIGLILINILTAIIRAFIDSGIQLIQFASIQLPAEEEQHKRRY